MSFKCRSLKSKAGLERGTYRSSCCSVCWILTVLLCFNVSVNQPSSSGGGGNSSGGGVGSSSGGGGVGSSSGGSSSGGPAALTESEEAPDMLNCEPSASSWEPMLCSEAEDGEAPLALELLYHCAQVTSPSEAVVVAGNRLMLETGFVPQVSLQTTWRPLTE